MRNGEIMDLRDVSEFLKIRNNYYSYITHEEKNPGPKNRNRVEIFKDRHNKVSERKTLKDLSLWRFLA